MCMHPLDQFRAATSAEEKQRLLIPTQAVLEPVGFITVLAGTSFGIIFTIISHACICVKIE